MRRDRQPGASWLLVSGIEEEPASAQAGEESRAISSLFKRLANQAPEKESPYTLN